MLAAAASPSSTTPPQIYRQFFTRAECRLLDSSPVEDALSEISLLRILLMRLLAARARQPQVAIAHSEPKGARSQPPSSMILSSQSEGPTPGARRSRSAGHGGAELTLKRHLAMLVAFSEAGFIMSSLARFNAKYCGLGDLSGMLLQAFAEMDPYDL